jgi:DNA-binding SARP family transcriptional activator
LDDEAWVDIEVAEAAAHKAESRLVLGDCKSAWGASLAALFIAEREFLPGEDAPWISDQRSRLAQVRRRALEAYAAAALGTGGTELPAAVRAGRQLVRLDPLRETGYQILMQSLAAQGNPAEALRVYADLCAVLRDELGVSTCSDRGRLPVPAPVGHARGTGRARAASESQIRRAEVST